MTILWREYNTVVRSEYDVRHRYMGDKKAQEHKLEGAAMTMLRCICGVTKLDRIRNEVIGGATNV